jgi:hypothetical protein
MLQGLTPGQRPEMGRTALVHICNSRSRIGPFTSSLGATSWITAHPTCACLLHSFVHSVVHRGIWCMNKGQVRMTTVLHAYIDESGVRGTSVSSSDHFVMSAVIFREEDRRKAADLLASLRLDLRRDPGQTLHWKKLKAHDQRLHVSTSIGAAPWLRTASVVVCKRHLYGEFDSQKRYLYTLRFLLERLSWLARDEDQVLHYTLSHIVRFKLATLREFEARLRAQTTQVHWAALSPKGGRLIHPNDEEELQLADLVASATAAAFEPDAYGHTEHRYLRKLRPRIYCRDRGALTSYGLKMHPWDERTRAAYPWVAAL